MEETGKKPTSDYKIVPNKNEITYSVYQFDYISRTWVKMLPHFSSTKSAKSFIDDHVQFKEKLRKHTQEKTIYYP